MDVINNVKKPFKIIIGMLTGIMIISTSVISSFATQFEINDIEEEKGSISGLPKKLTIQDNKGMAVSPLGEFYVNIKNLKPVQRYSKMITLKNELKNEKTFTLSMSSEFVKKTGNLDLAKYINEKISIDGKLVYDGKVTGEGRPSMENKTIDLVTLKPGDTSKMKVVWYWNGSGFKELKGQEYDGLVDFKWNFYATVKEEVVPTTTKTPTPTTAPTSPTDTGSDIAVKATAVAFVLLMISTVIYFIVRLRKIRKDKENEEQ